MHIDDGSMRPGALPAGKSARDVGAVFYGGEDWRHEIWRRWLYPDDLPVEWRLAYFNTQFSCVWLPNAAWRDTGLDEARTWVEDTHDGFRFLLEVGATTGPHEQSLIEILAPRLGLPCAADHPDLIWFGAGENLRGLARTLVDRAHEGRTIFLISRDGDRTTLAQVETMIGLLDLGTGAGVG